MKNIIFFLVLSIIPFFVKAQKVNNVPLTEISVPYVKVSAYTTMRFNGTIGLILDYGQRIPQFRIKETAVVKSDDEKIMDFNSLTDGINFLDAFGYEIFDTIVITEHEEPILYYIMKKKKYEDQTIY